MSLLARRIVHFNVFSGHGHLEIFRATIIRQGRNHLTGDCVEVRFDLSGFLKLPLYEERTYVRNLEQRRLLVLPRDGPCPRFAEF